jgi:hypothetical protein
MIRLGYIEGGVSISYFGRIQKIPKHKEILRPIYEAFINAIEAIRMYYDNDLSKGEIIIKIELNKTLLSEQNEDLEFNSITIEDNGIGFNETNFTRFLRLDDTSKGFGNKGSGRVQFIHYFDKAEFESVYADEVSMTDFKKRKFTLSKNKAFVQKNAIVRHDSDDETTENNTHTMLKLSFPLDNNDRNFYKEIKVEKIKEDLKNKYISLLCENRDSLPKITIQRTVNSIVETETTIEKDIIPQIDQKKDVEVYYSKINSTGKLEYSDKFEVLNLKSFKINQKELHKNSIQLVSKGEIAKEIKLECLPKDDIIDDNHYLFLLSGELIDNADEDARGNLKIATIEDLKKSQGDGDSLFPNEVITIEEIREKTNDSISKIYPEIKKYEEEKEKDREELRKMFLIPSDTMKKARIKSSDSEEEVLEKIYAADSKLIAQKDIEIKKRLESIKKLTPDKEHYQEDLKKEVDELTKVIPLQNRTALTQHIARRQLVLILFQDIIDRVKKGDAIDEKILHNLIFQQGSDKPDNSDLWLINEEFIYFQGISESQLGKIMYKGENILKDDLSQEEEEYRLKQSGDAKQKRTDILLFPKEGKCIIIELKAPDVNVSEHLNQISRYASLINNLSKEQFGFNTYYGYLIGENIDIDDIEDNDTDFKSAYSLDFIFRPYKRIAGKFGKNDGALYTEVIQYSTLLDRAKFRNQIFIDKLGINNIDNQK